MDIPGDGSNPNKDNDDDIEESSNEHEQRSGSNELLLSAQEATPGGQEFNDVQDDTNEQNNEIAVSPPGRQEAQTSELSRSFWCWCWSTLMVLGLSIGLFLQWLISALVNNIIRIFWSRNRNGHSKTDNSQAFDIFLYIFTLFAMLIFLTHTPLDVENTQPYNLIMPDNVNNIHQNLPINNGNDNVNENATLYNNFDDDITNRFTNDEYLEPNLQAIVTESIASEAVDDPTYSFDSMEAEDDILTNHDSDEESEQIFDSESDFDADDEAETDSDSDSSYNTKSENNSIDDNAESRIFEINVYINGEDDQTNDTSSEYYSANDNDRMSIMSHTTDDTDAEYYSANDGFDLDVSTDDGYFTKGENVSSIGDDEEVVLVEIQNNTPLDQNIPDVEQSIPLTLSTDSPSDQILIIEEDVNALIDVKHQEIIFSFKSTDTDSIKQLSSTSLNDESNEERSSLHVLDNPTYNISPPDLVESQDERHFNDVRSEVIEKITSSEPVLHDDDQNDHLVFNNNQQDQVAPSIEISLNNAQNNAQLNEISSTDEQRPTQISVLDSSSDQSSRIVQIPIDQIQDGCQEMVSSNRPPNMHFQKQSSPIVYPDEGLSKKSGE